jgi:hypothetical protein
MAKQPHWSVPVTFKVHGGRGEDAQQNIETLVQRLMKEADPEVGLVLGTVHRPARVRGAIADSCERCKS